MKKAYLPVLLLAVIAVLCSCMGGNNRFSGDKNSETSDVDNISSQIGTTAVSDKGYRIDYDADSFDYTSGDKDVFTSKTTGSFLEVYLSGGKTVDDCSDEYIAWLKNNGFAVTEPKSVTVGKEFYSARYISAQTDSEKRECYFLPAENECIVLIFDIKGDDEASLISMLDTLVIN